MIFTLATCAALVSLAVIPVARGADHQVIVGGGPLQFNPNQVVRFVWHQSIELHSHFFAIDCGSWRYRFIYLQAGQPYCYSVDAPEPLSASPEWF
jgi:hypothetical protein